MPLFDHDSEVAGTNPPGTADPGKDDISAEPGKLPSVEGHFQELEKYYLTSSDARVEAVRAGHDLRLQQAENDLLSVVNRRYQSIRDAVGSNLGSVDCLG